MHGVVDDNSGIDAGGVVIGQVTGSGPGVVAGTGVLVDHVAGRDLDVEVEDADAVATVGQN